MRKETYHTRKLCRSLEAQGALTYPLIQDEYTPAGWPDRYICHRRWRGFIEAKALKGKLSKAQVQVLNALVARGESVFVLWFSADWTEIMLQRHDGKCSQWGRWSSFFSLCEELS